MKDNLWLSKKPDSILDWLGVIFASIAFYMLMNNLSAVWGGFTTLLGILSPFAGGIVLAYILDPMVRFFQKNLFRQSKKWRWVSILMAYIVAILVIFLLAWLIIPQVGSSIATLFNNIPGYMQGVEDTLVSLQDRFGIDLGHAVQALDSYQDMLTSVSGMITGMAPQIMGYVGNVASNFVAVFTAVAASIYMLADKDHLLHQLHTVAHAVLPPRAAHTTLRICHYANENFTGFFVGKIIDSAIIGVITFVAMTVLRLDFALLIAVIVGITNIIPVFGPFIGAVPGTIILLFVDPLQALIFIVLILIIQQVDGNFIGPKILGQSIGISALWVLFSIVLGGDLFGLVGMVVGVPVFATFYGLAQEFIQFLLNRRGIDAEGAPLPIVHEGGDDEDAEKENLFE